MHRFLKQYSLRSIRHFSCRYLPEGSCSSLNRGGGGVVRSVACMRRHLCLKHCSYMVFMDGYCDEQDQTRKPIAVYGLSVVRSHDTC